MFSINKLNKKKVIFFLKYCLIGFLSICLELLLRNFLIDLKLNQLFILIIPLGVGIIFAFISNITFNFIFLDIIIKNHFFTFASFRYLLFHFNIFYLNSLYFKI